MSEFPLVVDLPAPVCREIGRVIVTFAAMELVLSKVIYAMLRLDQKAGRLAVKEPRATERFKLIRDLIALRGIPELPEFRELATAIDQVQTQRDQLAHGVWVQRPSDGALILRLTKGSWQPVKGQKGKTSRLVVPQGVLFSPAAARNLWQLIKILTKAIDRIGQALTSDSGPQQASPRKPPAPSP